MNITIYTAPIFTEIRQKSHLEVQDIKDVEARDNARAGVTKTEEINRCILEGMGQLERLCLRFLRETIVDETDDGTAMPQSYTFDFNFAERRAANKAEPLVSVMHSFVVQHALAQYYNTVNQVDMAGKHTALAQQYGAQITDMLYHKQPPRV